MPTYRLRCRKCNQECEVFCSIAERNSQTCAVCGNRLERVFAAPGISVWKDDWYWVDAKTRVWVSSKRQLFDECKKRNKFSIGYGQESVPVAE